MAVDRKYGKITAEHGDRVHGKPGVPLNESDNEPVFVLRAQDAASVPVLLSYLGESARAGADEVFIAAIDDVIDAFEKWQSEHPDSVKVPD